MSKGFKIVMIVMTLIFIFFALLIAFGSKENHIIDIGDEWYEPVFKLEIATQTPVYPTPTPTDPWPTPKPNWTMTPYDWPTVVSSATWVYVDTPTPIPTKVFPTIEAYPAPIENPIPSYP